MTLSEAQSKLRELHTPGERSRLTFDINEVGQESFTVSRIAGAQVHRGDSLKDPGDALFAANDLFAQCEMQTAVEGQFVRP